MPEFQIGSRLVGSTHPPLVVVELGINHEGSLDVAIEMADAAIGAGAEIIKHQTHIVEDEMSFEAKNVIPGNASESIYEIIERCALSEESEFKLKQYIESRGTIYISTPFSRAAANRLESFGVPAYKIGSGECNNYPLVKHIANFGKPVILSTGMNTIESIRPSVEIFRNAGIPFALMHCTNIYPTLPEHVRLGAIEVLQETFPDAVIGLSDHTTSNFTSLGAVALGASILERHFTDSKARPGPDIASSMDPLDLSNLIEGSKTIFMARGGKKEALKEEEPTIAFAFASVVVTRDIPKGARLSADNIWVKRPGGGDFSASEYELLFNREAAIDIRAGYQLKRSDLVD